MLILIALLCVLVTAKTEIVSDSSLDNFVFNEIMRNAVRVKLFVKKKF